MLTRRAELLRPDPNIMVRAMRLCAKNDPVTSRYTAGDGHHLELEVEPLPAGEADPDADGGIATAPTLITDEGAPPPTTVSTSARLPSSNPASVSGRQDLRRLTPGTVLAGYRLESLIGKGGMGRVYRATQLSMNRKVALKILAPRLTSKKSFRERFISEARHAGALQHPNLISVHDVGECDRLLFFSMELIEGETVRRLIEREGKIDETRSFIIAYQTLSALQYAHEQGLIHRDIKPDNLMLNQNGTLKIADLGLSRATEQDQRDNASTKFGSVMGTPHYMAPEQGKNASQADARSDLYAVGASLYHMVCGQVPFDGATPMETIMQAATHELEWPSPPPSQGMRKLIATLMAKDPADRPRSAKEALHLLEKVSGLSSSDISMSSGTSTLASTRRSASRRKRNGAWLPLGLTLAAAILIGAGWFLITRLRGQSAWHDVRQEVGRLVREEHFHAARQRLRDFAATDPAYPAPSVIDSTAAGIDEQWNKWSGENAALRQRVDLVHDHLMHRRIDEAKATLDALRADPNLLSPALRDEITQSIEPSLAELRKSDLMGWLNQAHFQPANDGDRLGGGPIPLRGLGELRLPPHPELPEHLRLKCTVVMPEQGLGFISLGDRGQHHYLRLDLLPRTLRLRRIPRHYLLFFKRLIPTDPDAPLPTDVAPRIEGFLEVGQALHEQTHTGTMHIDLVWAGSELTITLNDDRRFTTEHDPRRRPLIVNWLTDDPIRLSLDCLALE